MAFFSLEMSRGAAGHKRLLAGESFVDSQKMATGKLSEEEWTKLALASAALSQTDIRVDDNPSITVAEMNAKCRRLDNLGLVLVDYLQLMTGSGYGKGGENRVTVVSEISRALKIMAKELNVPVICLSQLSRANESRQDKRPILSDLRESGAIEQDADEVLFLYRDDYYNEKFRGKERGRMYCFQKPPRRDRYGRNSSGSPSTPPSPIGSGSMLNEAVERAPGYRRQPAIPLADICL
ncbi:MAG: DnaB-like helicase C-terminal domain-containing protein [Oscillospiraceae bacterium]